MTRLSNDEYYLSLLAGVAARGTCVRRRVGAIIVDKNHRVLSMGFNGPPSGFPHCGEYLQFKDGEISPYLYNIRCLGADEPKGVTLKCMAVHAEINALLSCGDLRHAHTMYLSCSPCRTCALAIANTPIERIVCLEVYADDARHIIEGARITMLVANTV